MTDSDTPPISIVMPTAGRPPILAESLAAIRAAAPAATEIVVAIEGEDEDSERVAANAGAATAHVSAGSGPGAARNAAIEQARSNVCLLCDDDIRPSGPMIDQHIEFHAAESDPMRALMGLVVPEPPLDRSAFQRWLHERGIQFAYGALRPGPVEGRHLWVANASFTRAALARIGGFDEAIGFGSEDSDLGQRFTAAGGRIIYRDDVVALHHRPTTLALTLERMGRIGTASRSHPERLARQTRPRPTGAGHRAALSSMGVAERAGFLRGPLLPAAWRLLCKQAYRESYWQEEPSAAGARLAKHLGERMAGSDPSAG